MNKKILLILASFLCTFCGSEQTGKKLESSSSQGKKLNVLMIAVDDLRPELGAYGNTLIHSPNIDKLASQGVTFSNAFCNIPVCGASRASLLTGTRPTRYRFLAYDERADQQVPNAIPISQLFKNGGYTTLSNGKVFHDKEDHAESWDVNWRIKPGGILSNYALSENIKLQETAKGPAFEKANVPDTIYTDGKIALKTIEDLKQLKTEGQPFFLAVGFIKPHLPFNAPQKYWDLYNRSDFEPTNPEKLPHNAPKEAFHTFGELRKYHGVPKEGPIGDSLSVSLQHGYYASVSYVDAQIGLVLEALDELGLRENTIVLLWGDHGWNLGEHGLWSKHCNFNTSLSAPLIISAPNMLTGHKSLVMTEFVDIYPTLSDLCGLEIPSTVEGKSLAAVLEDSAAKHKDFVISKYRDGLTLRTEQYAYTEWRKDDDSFVSSMLYDHYSDPMEMNNIVNNPENAALVDSLQKLLHANRGEDYFSKIEKEGMSVK